MALFTWFGSQETGEQPKITCSIVVLTKDGQLQSNTCYSKTQSADNLESLEVGWRIA
jgi:hypothetical protein